MQHANADSRVGQFLCMFLDKTAWIDYHCSWVPHC